MNPAQRIEEAASRVDAAASQLTYTAEKFANSSGSDKLFQHRCLLRNAREYGAAVRALARLKP